MNKNGEQLKNKIPDGITKVVGHIHSHTEGSDARVENFSVTTIAQRGDQAMMSENPELDYYLVTPGGALKVQRQDANSRELLLEGLNTEKAFPHLDNILGPNKSTQDLMPVDDNDPIDGKYNPKDYKPPGYNNPMEKGCIGRYNQPPPWLKKDKDNFSEDLWNPIIHIHHAEQTIFFCRCLHKHCSVFL